jgi:hypothetical protein
MIYLLLSLLGFGLIQSLLELVKDTEKPYKKIVQKTLAGVYILGFIIGVIITIQQEKESFNYNKLIGGISVSVTKIDSSFPGVLQKLNTSLVETKLLIKSSDSMNKNMVSLIKIRDSLTVQTKLINDRLSRQIDLDKQTLKEKEATIVMLDTDINWYHKDSNSSYLKVAIRNFGKRNAIVESGLGYIVFFNHQNEPLAFQYLPGDSIADILQPDEIQKFNITYISYPIKKFGLIKSQTSFAIICLKIKYKDVLNEIEKINYFYSGWMPNEPGFGAMGNSRTHLAKQWAKANNILQ